MTDIVFAVESLESCWSDIYEAPNGLAYLHWCETQKHRHNQPYLPLYSRYSQYEKAGWFIQSTVRMNGLLIGYGGFYVTPSMHTQCLVATEDTWYLLPEYRKGWTAVKFRKFMENAAAKSGAIEMTLTIPKSKKAGLLKMLERDGYEETASVVSKKLLTK